ncbi:MAG: hemerythrin domain-containing protein [Clostridiales bacterium]|nr:hemerythrin domain-containing protein [Clostridiales bacterium]
MNSIELMVEEHKNIIRMLTVVRQASYGILKGDEICYEDFEQMIDFIRNYADVHHHGKEEKFLFKEMVDNLGPLADKLVTHGMLVEHDWGRLFIHELSNALEQVKRGDEMSKIDVIANAIGYANHLQRHIEKEDSVVYPFAERKLSAEIMERVEKASWEFEKDAEEKNIPSYYLELLENLEKKYLK